MAPVCVAAGHRRRAPTAVPSQGLADARGDARPGVGPDQARQQSAPPASPPAAGPDGGPGLRRGRRGGTGEPGRPSPRPGTPPQNPAGLAGSGVPGQGAPGQGPGGPRGNGPAGPRGGNPGPGAQPGSGGPAGSGGPGQRPPASGPNGPGGAGAAGPGMSGPGMPSPGMPGAGVPGPGKAGPRPAPPESRRPEPGGRPEPGWPESRRRVTRLARIQQVRIRAARIQRARARRARAVARAPRGVLMRPGRPVLVSPAGAVACPVAPVPVRTAPVRPAPPDRQGSGGGPGRRRHAGSTRFTAGPRRSSGFRRSTRPRRSSGPRPTWRRASRASAAPRGPGQQGPGPRGRRPGCTEPWRSAISRVRPARGRQRAAGGPGQPVRAGSRPRCRRCLAAALRWCPAHREPWYLARPGRCPASARPEVGDPVRSRPTRWDGVPTTILILRTKTPVRILTANLVHRPADAGVRTIAALVAVLLGVIPGYLVWSEGTQQPGVRVDGRAGRAIWAASSSTTRRSTAGGAYRCARSTNGTRVVEDRRRDSDAYRAALKAAGWTGRRRRTVPRCRRDLHVLAARCQATGPRGSGRSSARRTTADGGRPQPNSPATKPGGTCEPTAVQRRSSTVRPRRRPGGHAQRPGKCALPARTPHQHGCPMYALLSCRYGPTLWRSDGAARAARSSSTRASPGGLPGQWTGRPRNG